MGKLKNLRDGLIDELKDIYNAENQLLKALPKMAKSASNGKLKEAILSHIEETEGQVERLEQIGELLEVKLSGKTCKAMKGLIEEGKEILEEDIENEALKDALMIGAAQRIEHYEIAAYGTARAMAQALGEDKIAEILDQTLNEESAADEKLTTISESEVLAEANEEEDEGEQNDDSEEEDAEKIETRSSASKNKKSTGGSARALLVAGMMLIAPLFAGTAIAENAPSAQHDAEQYAPDNTGRNVRDADGRMKTADDQSLTDSQETELLAKIRREIVANDALSTSGKNVKIVVDSGTVTLRGPVRSAEEKKWIESATQKVAAGYKVDNQIEVASS